MGAGGGWDPPPCHPQGGRAERWPELGTPPPGPAAPVQRGHPAALPHAAPSQGCSQHPPWCCSTWGSWVGGGPGWAVRHRPGISCLEQEEENLVAQASRLLSPPRQVFGCPLGVTIPCPASWSIPGDQPPAAGTPAPHQHPGGSQGAAPMGEGLPPDSPAGCSRGAPRINPPPPGPQSQRGRLAADVEGKELRIPSPNRVPQRQPCSSPPSSRPAESKHPAAAAHSCAGPGLGAAAPRPHPHEEPMGAVSSPRGAGHDRGVIPAAFGGFRRCPLAPQGRVWRCCGVLQEVGVIYFRPWSRASTGLGVPDPRKAAAG